MATNVSLIDSETNAFYLGLFDRPADPNGQTYWIGQSGGPSSSALSPADVNSTGSFATYFNGGGVPLSSSNIANEIVSIYSNLLGAAVTTTNSGVEYWAAQFDAGATIGQITASIYNIVENLPSTNIYNETMNAKIDAAQTFTQYYVATGTPSPYSDGITNELNNDYTQSNVLNGTLPSIIGITPGTVSTWGDANYIFNIANNDGANTTLTAGNGNDTINTAGANTNFFGTETFVLGTGADTINSLGIGNHIITIGTPAAAYTNTNAVSITDNAGMGNNTITVNGSGANFVDLLQNNGNNSIAMTGNGNNAVWTGQGNNSITDSCRKAPCFSYGDIRQ
ncbi:MAG: hypothetical protein ACYCTB_08545 [bacterium]